MTPLKALGLAAVLGALLFFIFKVEMPKEAEREREGALVKEASAHSTKRVEITKGGTSFALVNPSPEAPPKGEETKADSFKKWQIEGIVGSSVDEGSASSLMSALKSLKLTAPLPKEDLEKDLSIYGLATPEVKVKVETLEGAGEVLLGKKVEFVRNRYAKRADDESIYLISDDLYLAASKPKDDFRDKTPLDFDTTDVKSVTLEANGKKTVLEQKDGKWRITEPVKASADESHVSELLRKLRTLRAKEFIDPPNAQPAAHRLDKPDAKIHLSLRDRELDLALVGARGGDAAMYYNISDRPTIFKIEGNTVSTYTVGANELRKRNLFEIDPESITALTVSEEGGAPLELKKTSEGRWTVGEKDGDEAFIKEYLERVSKIEASDFPGGALTIEKPLFTITAKGPGDKESSLLVGAVEEQGGKRRHPAIVKGTEEPFYLSAESVTGLKPKREVLVKATPVPTGTGSQTGTASPGISPSPVSASPTAAPSPPPR